MYSFPRPNGIQRKAKRRCLKFFFKKGIRAPEESRALGGQTPPPPSPTPWEVCRAAGVHRWGGGKTPPSTGNSMPPLTHLALPPRVQFAPALTQKQSLWVSLQTRRTLHLSQSENTRRLGRHKHTNKQTNGQRYKRHQNRTKQKHQGRNERNTKREGKNKILSVFGFGYICPLQGGTKKQKG